MIVTLMAAVALLTQTAPVAAPQPALAVDLPAVEGLAADPACGGRPPLATIATCFATTQAQVDTVVDAWNAAFAQQGWVAADGENNRILYIRRKDGGGCAAFQVLVFADEMQTMAPEAPAYFALATIPSDVCTAALAAPAPATPDAPVTPQ